MSRSLFEALFYGRISTWERKVTLTPERKELERKIESEKRHFIEKMSLDDVQRFEKLENLYVQSSEENDVDVFSHGFIMGSLIMLEVLAGRDSVINE